MVFRTRCNEAGDHNKDITVLAKVISEVTWKFFYVQYRQPWKHQQRRVYWNALMFCERLEGKLVNAHRHNEI